MSATVDLWDQAQLDVAIKPRAPGCHVPLTALQMRTWKYYAKQGRPESVRMCAAAKRVIGPLDVGLLRRSIEFVVGRHESLRTRIAIIDEVPRQLIDEACEYDLEVMEIAAATPREALGEARRLAREFLEQKIDLSEGPLFTAKLWRISQHEHVLVLALDHMVGDAISNEILTGEIWDLYNQGAQKLPFSLPKLSIQFADYAVWQQKVYAEWRNKHEAYWKSRLAGAPRVQLSCDAGLLDSKCLTGAVLHFPFGGVLSASLRSVAQQHNAPLPLLVLVVYTIVLSRWCNQEDLIILFISHGRYGRPELVGMIGFLATFLHLRVDVAQDSSFLDLLKRLQLEFKSTCEHRDFDRALDLVPDCISELCFNWLPSRTTKSSIDRELVAAADIRLEPFALKGLPPAKFLPFFYDSAAGIGVTVHYRPDLLGRSTIERFGRNLRSVASEFIQNPHTRIASASMEVS